MNSSLLAYRLINGGLNSLIVKNNTEIDEIADAANFFNDFFKKSFNIARFYSYEIAPKSAVPPSDRTVKGRISALYQLLSSKNTLFLTNINSLVQPVIAEEKFIDNFFALSINDNTEINRLAKKLLNMNYKRVNYVESTGQFAVRGSIVDIFSPFYDKPVRLDFFDNDIEDIRLFFQSNQRTYKHLKQAVILIAGEYRYTDDEFGYALLEQENQICHLTDYDDFLHLKHCLSADRDFLNDVYEKLKFYKDIAENLFLKKSHIEQLSEQSQSCDFSNNYTPLFADNLSIDEKIGVILEKSMANRIILTCASKPRLDRVGRFLNDKGVKFSIINNDVQPAMSGFYLSDGFLKHGFWDKKNSISFLGFEDLFGKVIQKPVVRAAYSRKTFADDSKIVHKNYGIGIYKGIKKINVDGLYQDFLQIEYNDNDVLYVPITNMELLFEYHGSAEIDSLKSSKWQRKQSLIKKSIRKILSELVHSYAQRQIVKRTRYIVDTIMYREFEASFEYEETPDQMKAIKDVENDMSKDVPMDRLVCGDVSFGKTEIAMRAAAIAVFNDKQVVVMSPTTILSMQHYNTFKMRFENMPVRIELLNRFTAKKQREEVYSDLKNGKIDILIATHSVYSYKVNFLNLSLVVIDEEQRFGVKIKEHLKSRYADVDMLYLSATPIPRTLNMGLSGIFDMSIIKTPPLMRKPIETFVLRRKRAVIRDAVLRELSRGGNILFVHNRIEDIESIKDELDSIIPNVEKSIVHAQMSKYDIKNTFVQFEDNKIRILITTSIVESGLNLKNANTIIIDNSENFGLSDLYQLRGRVGRGDKTAYAYLLTHAGISPKAEQRLAYMKEFVERGVGFNIALKDMELRGTGNILGRDQSGNIKAVGFETYAHMMEEAIAEMKKETVSRDIEIKNSFDAYIPDEFAQVDDKFSIYKTIANSKDEEDIEMIRSDLKDRFGALAEPVENLLHIAVIKIYAKIAFVKMLSLSSNRVVVEFYLDADIDTGQLIKGIERLHGKFVSQNTIFLPVKKDNLRDIAAELKSFFGSLSHAAL